MIVTVTANTGLDRVLFLDRFERGRRNQVRRAVEAMGGKGTDVSLVLAQLGVPSIATGFIGGTTGARIDAWLSAAGVSTAFVEVEGESRQNIVLLEAKNGGHTTLCPEGLRVSTSDLATLTERVLGTVSRGDVVVLAGSVPEAAPTGYYAGLIPKFQGRGVRVILDSSGQCLLTGAAALPWGLKPNREELELLAGRPITDATVALKAAREWAARGVGLFIASLGEEGAVAVDGTGAWHAPALDIPVVNPAGAGDAVVAAMAIGATRDADTPEILRSAVALASAVVLTEGTAECRRGDYERLLPLVQVRPVT